jgi:hypothetical protein
MSALCKGTTIARDLGLLGKRTAHACQWAAKQDGYCPMHHPARRREVLERQKRDLSDRLAVVLTELIAVTAQCEEIERGGS